MTALLIGVLVAFTACENIKENMTVTIPINEKEIIFEIPGEDAAQRANKYPSAPAAEVELLNTLLKLNLADVARENGYDFDRIVELLLTKAELELISPAGFNMGVFDKLKLYIEDRTKLVAQAEKVKGNVVIIKIVNGDLLTKFKEDNLHIILTGETMPKERVKLKLKTSYQAKIKVYK